MSEIVRLEARVYGLVQGVSFRYYTYKQALSLGVKGYVRNMTDGSVEVVAEGYRDGVESLLAWLRQGPPSAEVEHVEVIWTEPRTEFEEFEVRL